MALVRNIFTRIQCTTDPRTSVYSWSASFYPQPLLNWRRKSTEGLTVDFPALNVVGFVSYSISTASFLFSPEIRRQYALRHPRSPEPTVRLNDFVFAAHAMVLVALTYSQFYPFLWKFHVPKGQKTSTVVRIIVAGSAIVVVLGAVRAVANHGNGDSAARLWSWIDVVRSSVEALYSS